MSFTKVTPYLWWRFSGSTTEGFLIHLNPEPGNLEQASNLDKAVASSVGALRNCLLSPKEDKK